jgi:hypothetical protein
MWLNSKSFSKILVRGCIEEDLLTDFAGDTEEACPWHLGVDAAVVSQYWEAWKKEPSCISCLSSRFCCYLVKVREKCCE